MKTEYYVTLANLTAFIHGLVALYFLGFGILYFLGRKTPTLYLLSLIPLAIIQWIFVIWKGTCPLVLLENYFRELGNQGVLGKDGFISHYVNKFFHVYVPGGAIEMSMGLITGVILLVIVQKFFPNREVST